MVSRSHTAIESKTVLVGEFILGLIIDTYYLKSIKNTKPAQDNDDDTIGEEGDEHEDWHEEAIDWLNNIQRTQPGGSIDYVATSFLLATRTKCSTCQNFPKNAFYS